MNITLMLDKDGVVVGYGKDELHAYLNASAKDPQLCDPIYGKVGSECSPTSNEDCLFCMKQKGARFLSFPVETLLGSQGSREEKDHVEYWLYRAMLEFTAEHDCTNCEPGEHCAQFGDCITEWCVPCAARKALTALREGSKKGGGGGDGK